MDSSQTLLSVIPKSTASPSAPRMINTNHSTSHPPPTPQPPFFLNTNNGASSSNAGLYTPEFPTPVTTKSFKPSVLMEYLAAPHVIPAELTTTMPFPIFYPSKYPPSSHSAATSPYVFLPDLIDDMEGLKISFIKNQDLEDLANKTTTFAPDSSLYLNDILNSALSSQSTYTLNPPSMDNSPPKGLEDLIPDDRLANKTTLVAPYSSLCPNNILNPDRLANKTTFVAPYSSLYPNKILNPDRLANKTTLVAPYSSLDPNNILNPDRLANKTTLVAPYSSLYPNNILNPAIPSQSPYFLNPPSVDQSPPKGYEFNLTKGSNAEPVVKEIDVDQEGGFLFARFDMPGVLKEGLKVWKNMKQNTLYIEGKEMKTEGDEYSKEDEKELRSYAARIPIDPAKYKLDLVKASLKNGVLKILVPKMKFEEMEGVSLVEVE